MSTLVLRGGRVGLGGPVGDVVVRDGRIARIGPLDHSSAPSAPSPVEVVELDDATVLPGLVDAHVHVDQLAHVAHRIDVSGSTSPRVVADKLAGRPAAGVVVGHGFVDGLWDAPPHKDLLDERLPGVPVVVISFDLHTVWASSAALERFGVQSEDGVLREGPAMALIARVQASVPDATVDSWVQTELTAMRARGVTGLLDFEYADNLASWSRRPTPPLRVHAAVWPEWLDAAVAAGCRTGDELAPRVHVGPLKVVADGSLNTRTAWCHVPYPDSGSTGMALVSPSDLVALLRRGSRAGLAPAVHAIGDRANTMVLDAFEAVGCPGRIEHAQLVAPADLERFAHLDVVASIQPQHAMADRDVAERQWPGRTDRAFAYRSLHDAGVRLVLGSDAPVSVPDPWHAVADAVLRTDDERAPWHPEQALPLATAIAAASGGRSSISVGDVADLTVVAGPLSDARTVRDTEVLHTLVGGSL